MYTAPDRWAQALAPIARRLLTALLLLAAGPHVGLHAQEAGSPPAAALDLAQIDSLLERAEPARALTVLEPWIEAHPEDLEALWRAARAEALGGLIEPNLKDARAYYRRGIGYSERALAIDSLHVPVREWTMVNKGRLALWTGARETADLAQEVWDMAHGLLAEDEDNAIAHHALGVIHYEVRKMSWAKRVLARLFLGGDPLHKTRWDLATEHLRRAVVLDPSSKLFRLYYVRAIARQGWEDLSVTEARMGVARPNRHALDSRFDVLLRRHVEEHAGEAG